MGLVLGGEFSSSRSPDLHWSFVSLPCFVLFSQQVEVSGTYAQTPMMYPTSPSLSPSNLPAKSDNTDYVINASLDLRLTFVYFVLLSQHVINATYCVVITTELNIYVVIRFRLRSHPCIRLSWRMGLATPTALGGTMGIYHQTTRCGEDEGLERKGRGVPRKTLIFVRVTPCYMPNLPKTTLKRECKDRPQNRCAKTDSAVTSTRRCIFWSNFEIDPTFTTPQTIRIVFRLRCFVLLSRHTKDLCTNLTPLSKISLPFPGRPVFVNSLSQPDLDGTWCKRCMW